jgi:ABC-2 type transport system permease protein
MYILGQVISAYALATALRMRTEELDGRADPLLATPVSRLRWAWSHLAFAMLGPTVVLAVLGLAIGVGYGLTAGAIGAELPRLLARTMATLPAIWVMAGLAAALYGLLPRFAVALSWAALALFLTLELGWEVQRLSQAVFDISPFAHVHWAIQVTAASLIGLTLVAAALTAAGLAGLRRRDIG